MDTNPNPLEINSKDADATDMELQILAAMRSRLTYLRNEADSFTFTSVRRLLEEDMGLEKYALDVHKSYVKEHLVKCLEEAGNDENFQDDATPVKEVANASEEHEANNDVSEEAADDEKTVAGDMKDEVNREALIKRALRKRSSYINANSEEITMASLRRLLEEDLKLKKNSLDPFKKFINKELDDVLQIPDAPKPSTKLTGKIVKKIVKRSSEEKSESDAGDDLDDEVVAVTQKSKLSKAEMTGKRKFENGKPMAAKKKAKHTDTDSEDSDAGDSEMRAEKPLKAKKSTPTSSVYGKRVEHLKSVIKSCGLSVPPVIYRKVKQAPEEKRESTLIEDLEQILAKEGLSSDPSEKEIKEVKKKKDISKELEGIDTSNIVSSSRRRSTTSFGPPPKPIITSESESYEEDAENGEDNEDAEEGSQSNEDDGGEESE